MELTDSILLLDEALEDRVFKAFLNHARLLKLTDSLKAAEFTTTLKAHLFDTLTNYYTSYQTIPTLDILLFEFKDRYTEVEATKLRRYLTKLDKLPVPEFAWVITKLDRWIKKIQFHKALFEASEKLKEDNLDEAISRVITSVRKSGITDISGLNDLILSQDQIREMVDDADELCTPTMIHALDAVVDGLYRKELFIILAALNVGKSWCANQFVSSALIHGKYVMKFTLEMRKKKDMQRLFQSVSGAVKQKSNEEYSRTVKYWGDDWESRHEAEVVSLLNVDKVKGHWDTLSRYGGWLHVIEKSSGECSVADIDREIIKFDTAVGKPPDLVVVDGLLDLKEVAEGAGKERQILANCARKFRAMAEEYNSAFVATHQANRDALTAELTEAEHTGESLGILQVADTGISLNQTKREYELDKMRAYVVRCRGRKKWAVIDLYQNIEIGQFCQGSRLVPAHEMEATQSVEQNDSPRARFKRRNQG